MLQSMKPKKKDTKGKSSKDLLEARSKAAKKEEGRAGRPTKHPRTEETKRMNIFLPGTLHKDLRLASVTCDQSMNEIIIDILLANLKKYESNNG